MIQPSTPANTETIWEKITFGTYPLTHTITHRRLNITFDKSTGLLHYKRELDGKRFEADIAATCKDYHIIPAGANHVPAPVTDFLQIRFNEIEIEPGCKTTLYTTAPLELAVTIETPEKEIKLLDIISFAKAKFALYGTATRGIITRLSKSAITTRPPAVKNYKEFLLKITLENKSGKWISLGYLILYLKGLTLYYDTENAAASINLTIINETTAQITCIDEPPRKNMTKAEPIFRNRKPDTFCNIKTGITDKTFTMDMGLN